MLGVSPGASPHRWLGKNGWNSQPEKDINGQGLRAENKYTLTCTGPNVSINKGQQDEPLLNPEEQRTHTQSGRDLVSTRVALTLDEPRSLHLPTSFTFSFGCDPKAVQAEFQHIHPLYNTDVFLIKTSRPMRMWIPPYPGKHRKSKGSWWHSRRIIWGGVWGGNIPCPTVSGCIFPPTGVSVKAALKVVSTGRWCPKGNKCENSWFNFN